MEIAVLLPDFTTQMEPKGSLMTSKEVVTTIRTQCSHIVPYASGSVDLGLSGDVSEEVGYCPFDEKVLTDLKVTPFCSVMGFVPILPSCQDILDIHQPGTINKPRNSMTMGRTLHSEFAAFKLALEHVHVCHPPIHSHYFIFDYILTMPRITLTP